MPFVKTRKPLVLSVELCIDKALACGIEDLQRNHEMAKTLSATSWS